jgi:Bacterial Ig-like domain (group 3)/Dockerin type I domain/Bacterial Ig-like domain (group 2)
MTNRRLSFGIDFLVIVLFLVGCVSGSQAQEITVTSPASGALYAPGSTINVTATVSGGSVVAVAAAAQGMATSSYQLKAPYSMSLVVPADVIGPKNLFAVGVIASNTAIFSPMITVDIEPSIAPASLTFDQSLVAFGYVGQQQKVGVTATFSDGSVLDLSKSTKLSFTSSNPSVVSVDPTGLLTSLTAGNTTVKVAYGALTATLRTVGPTIVKGDLNGDGLVTLSDLLLLETFVGSTPTGLNDARDLNGDGKIDNLDVELLLAHCGNNCPSLNVTTTSLSSSASKAQFTQPITFTASVAGNAPKGAVSFLVDGELAETAFLGTTGEASFVSDSLSVGGHTITALYDGDTGHGPSASLPVSVTITPVPGDVNGDGVVDCLDLSLVKAAFGTKSGQPAFNPAADVNHDGVVNVLDLSYVARMVPAGTTCP